MHRFHHPEDPDGSLILLFHGTGGNEADLMPIARRVAPRATLLGVRGRAHEEGVARWFRRFSATSFDQSDIAAEAGAFRAFMEDAVRGYGLDGQRMTVLGYSNGANFAGAVMGLHPGTIRRAILLRTLPVLDPLPAPDLTGTEVLIVEGKADPFVEAPDALGSWLRRSGAAVERHRIDAGHELTPEDADLAGRWLAAHA